MASIRGAGICENLLVSVTDRGGVIEVRGLRRDYTQIQFHSGHSDVGIYILYTVKDKGTCILSKLNISIYFCFIYLGFTYFIYTRQTDRLRIFTRVHERGWVQKLVLS